MYLYDCNKFFLLLFIIQMNRGLIFYSAFKCSFDEFVGEKVVSPSYSSDILAPPPIFFYISVHSLKLKAE